MNTNPLGTKLWARRIQKDYTLTQAAVALHTGPSTIWQWESGALPRQASLPTIAKYLGITLDEMRRLWTAQRKAK